MKWEVGCRKWQTHLISFHPDYTFWFYTNTFTLLKAKLNVLHYADCVEDDFRWKRPLDTLSVRIKIHFPSCKKRHTDDYIYHLHENRIRSGESKRKNKPKIWKQKKMNETQIWFFLLLPLILAKCLCIVCMWGEGLGKRVFMFISLFVGALEIGSKSKLRNEWTIRIWCHSDGFDSNFVPFDAILLAIRTHWDVSIYSSFCF